MRPVKHPDWHLVCHHLAKIFPGEPDVKVEGGRFNLEGWLAQMRKVEVDRMIGRRTDRAGTACEQGQRCTMNVAAADELHTRMAPEDRSQLIGTV